MCSGFSTAKKTAINEVLTIEDWVSGGSKIKMAMDERIIKVKESPEQIIKQLTTIKTINYDS